MHYDYSMIWKNSKCLMLIERYSYSSLPFYVYFFAEYDIKVDVSGGTFWTQVPINKQLLQLRKSHQSGSQRDQCDADWCSGTFPFHHLLQNFVTSAKEILPVLSCSIVFRLWLSFPNWASIWKSRFVVIIARAWACEARASNWLRARDCSWELAFGFS